MTIKIRKLAGNSGNNRFDIIDDEGKIYCHLFKYMNPGSKKATIFLNDDSVHTILDDERYKHLKSRLTDSVFFETESEAIACLKFIDSTLFGVQQ